MKLLAIDTTTEACSAALLLGSERHEKYAVAPRQHAELILPMVDDLLVECGLSLSALDGLAFCRGPGAFTGVRLCSSIVQGLAFACDLPVVPVSSLAALAEAEKSRATTLVSAIDARMGEIYWGVFTLAGDGLVTAASAEAVSEPGALTLGIDSPCFGVGTGWGRYGDILATRIGSHLTGMSAQRLPRASDILGIAAREFREGRFVDAAHALPVYLRNKVTA